MKFVMTTALYSPSAPIAGEMHILRLSQELIKHGHEVHIIYSWDANRFKHYSPEGDTIESRKDENGIYFHPIHSKIGSIDPYLSYLAGNSPFVFNQFRYLISNLKPDIVHHHGIFLLGYKIMKKQSNYLNIFTAHDFWLICLRNDLLKNGRGPCLGKSCFSCGLHSLSDKRPPQLWRYSSDFRRSLHDIDLIIVPTEFNKRKTEKELNCPVRCLPFFAVPRQNVRDSGYSNFFLYAGKLTEQKGVMDILEAFSRFRNSIDRNLIIVGQGPLFRQIKDYIKNNNLANKVTLLGFVDIDTLWSLYKNALALIVPSIWPENCPAVALEALSMGTPVIGSDQGGMPEIIEKIDRKLIFRAGNPEQIAEILSSFNEYSYSTEVLKKIFKDNYTVESYVDKYEELITLMRGST